MTNLMLRRVASRMSHDAEGTNTVPLASAISASGLSGLFEIQLQRPDSNVRAQAQEQAR
jgi:hypothetical protein